MQEIGPAILNGGFSTFIALALLGTSESYVFFSFFKVFVLIIIFGLYHGLIFLPVILSIVGPDSYSTARENPNLKANQVAALGTSLPYGTTAKENGVTNGGVANGINHPSKRESTKL